MYKLYYDQRSAAEGVRVILEEVGVPYELVASYKDRSKPRPPEQLIINPNGWLPVLLGARQGCMNVQQQLYFFVINILKQNLLPCPTKQIEHSICKLCYISPILFRLHFKRSFILIGLLIGLRMRRAPNCVACCD